MLLRHLRILLNKALNESSLSDTRLSPEGLEFREYMRDAAKMIRGVFGKYGAKVVIGTDFWHESEQGNERNNQPFKYAASFAVDVPVPDWRAGSDGDGYPRRDVQQSVSIEVDGWWRQERNMDMSSPWMKVTVVFHGWSSALKNETTEIPLVKTYRLDDLKRSKLVSDLERLRHYTIPFFIGRLDVGVAQVRIG